MSDVTFYATINSDSMRPYIPAVPVMLPASSWAQKRHTQPLPPVRGLPDHVTERAADCGGFVATRIWGDYRYTPEQYVAWLHSFSPQWAATMDYCCEKEITGQNDGVVRERQHRTTAMAHRFWTEHRDVPWCWVPTVQGWEPEEYRRHARELAPLVAEMRAYYGPDSAFRVGVGTLCARASTATIRQVVGIVRAELPGVPLHLWGVKLGFLKAATALPANVVSIDSAAWNARFGSDIELARAESSSRSLTQREHDYLVALPRYIDKVGRAQRGAKQVEFDLESA